MKIWIVGHLGQLATDFKRVFAAEELILTEKEDLPIESAGPVIEFARASRPDLILNCAAYNRVDEAEEAPEAAFAANAFGPRNLALAAREVNAPLVHFSTDYVFDGPKRTPYIEEDMISPKSVYGVSKAAGELMVQATWDKHYICRVCGLYGYAGSREKGSNFVETMIDLARQGKPLRVVADQILTPTSTIDVAAATAAIIHTGRFGLYHMTSSGECSWYDFARTIFQLSGLAVDLTPVPSTAYPTRARRPAYSVLDNRALRLAGLPDMPHWTNALKRYLDGRPSHGRQ